MAPPTSKVAKEAAEIGRMLADPMIQVYITLNQSLERTLKDAEVGKLIDTLLEESKKDPENVYKVRYLDESVSIYIYNGLVVAIVKDPEEVLEPEALTRYETAVGQAELWVFPVSVLPDELRNLLSKASPAVVVKPPPHGWVGLELAGFRVEGVLSEKGAFNYVLAAVAPWGERVALKVARDRSVEGKPMAVGGGPSVIARLASEASVMQRLSNADPRMLRNMLSMRGHPQDMAERLVGYRRNVVRVYAVYIPFYEYSDQEQYFTNPPFAAMELAEGDLTELIKEGRISVDEAVELTLDHVAGALALAHAMGYGHFDLKPDNILYRKDKDGSLTLKLADFSGYNAVDGRFLIEVLTPEYGDPYAIALGGRGASLASDVYNFGSLLLRLYKGSPSPCIWALNALLLQRVTGLPIMQDKLALLAQTGPEAKRYVDRLRAAILKQPRSLRLSDLISSIESIYWECVSHDIESAPPKIRGILERSLRLHPASRYRDMVQVYRAVYGI